MRFVALFIALVITAAPARAERFFRSVDAIPHSYIVVLNDAMLGPPEGLQQSVNVAATQLSAAFGGEVRARWHRGIRGLHLEMNEGQARGMSNHPLVSYVEEDARIFVSGTQSTPFSLRNLDRIDQLSATPDETYNYECPGVGIPVYVVDTGVLAAHTEFGGRVQTGADFAPPDGYSQTNPGVTGVDNYTAGHGTAVASVIAGTTFGVAKSARIIPVRVINKDGAGAVSNLLSGLEWILDDYNANQTKPAVVNMSIFQRLQNPLLNWTVNATAGEGSSIDAMVNALLSWGLTVVASANNQNTDACYTTPARIPGVITVAGSSITVGQLNNFIDTWWITSNPLYVEWTNTDPGSNWGSCVDIIAPAADIRSAHTRSTTSERQAFKSGTSFAAPHVSGTVARYLQAGNKSTGWPSAVWTWLSGNAASGVVIGVPSGTPNKLLYAPYNCRW